VASPGSYLRARQLQETPAKGPQLCPVLGAFAVHDEGRGPHVARTGQGTERFKNLYVGVAGRERKATRLCERPSLSARFSEMLFALFAHC
jgi:hypothetical protein